MAAIPLVIITLNIITPLRCFVKHFVLKGLQSLRRAEKYKKMAEILLDNTALIRYVNNSKFGGLKG